MCGIAGIYAYHPDAPSVDRRELVRIRDAQVTRGPDALGAWYSKNERVALGHRRLSIIDLSADANQPMDCEDSNYVIVFNGEIYNYRVLRSELIADGFIFKTQSDTEVLLKGYQHWGKGLLQKLRGMYAFAIWDGTRSEILLARDPYGIKPLYYSTDGYTLRFASQVKALLQGQLHTLQLDPAGIAGFLMMGSVPEPYTIYSAIHSLGAGEYLLVDGNGIKKTKSYFSITDVWRNAESAPKIATEKEIEQVMDCALRDTVDHHMVADVPVGAFLSAGIDSGALVGLMSEKNQRPIKTVTLGFADFRGLHNDETILAEEMAKLYGTTHETHWVSNKEVEQDLPLVLDAMDQPSIDGINTWLVCKVAHQRGLKVVASGVGGDELFGGYDHFDQLPRWHKNNKLLSLVPGARQISYHLFKGLVKAGLFPAKTPALVRYGESYHGLYLTRRGLFMPWEISNLIGPDMAKAGLEKLAPPEFIKKALGQMPKEDYAIVSALESVWYLRNQLLRDSDWASMAHSLELRTPLVDIYLLKSLAPYLVRANRSPKRKTVFAKVPRPALPDHVVNRKKSGFTLPMEKWIAENEIFSNWRSFPAVTRSKCHWSRKMACALIARNLK